MQRVVLANGAIEIEIWDLGARLNRVTFDGIGNLVDGAETETEARTDKLNHGSIAGPVANRISSGKAIIAGEEYAFEKNENGCTLLHSGSKSTRDALWELVSCRESEATFEVQLPHLADGFPGNRKLRAIYRLVEDGFDVTFEAETDAPTLMNMVGSICGFKELLEA